MEVPGVGLKKENESRDSFSSKKTEIIGMNYIFPIIPNFVELMKSTIF